MIIRPMTKWTRVFAFLPKTMTEGADYGTVVWLGWVWRRQISFKYPPEYSLEKPKELS